MNKWFLSFLCIFMLAGCDTPECVENCEENPSQPPAPPSYDDTCWGLAYQSGTQLDDNKPTNATCETELLFDENILLIGDLGEMQVHLDAAFDGQQLYLVYNFADSETEGMGVAGRVLQCDGSLGAETTIASGTLTQSDPQIALAGEHLMVAWQKDDPGQSPANLSMLVQAFDTSFTPLLANEQELSMARNGVVQTKNVWMPAIIPAYSEGFWVIGARGHDAATAFQAFAQLIHSNGEMQCDSIDLNLEPAIGQVYPVAASGGGKIIAAWESHQAEGSEIEFVHTANGFLHTGQTQITFGTGEAQRPAVALSPDGERAALAYAIQNGGTWRTYLAHPDHLDTIISVGNANQSAHSPAVALGENGGLIFWLENVAGTKNRAYYQAFVWEDNGYALQGSPTDMGDETVLPYAPVMLHLGADHYFMGWMAGNHPNYQAYGRFVAPSQLQ